VPDNTSPFVIRRAEAADKAKVLAFCKHTFDWGDYLHLVWNDWLADKAGSLLVATLGEEPVGVAKVTLVTPAEAWLQGLRVHPEYRRRGLAWQFHNHCLGVAKELGASVARLATSSTNTPVHRMMERGGLRRVAEVQVLQATSVAAGEDARTLSPLTQEDWTQVSRRTFDGAALAAMGGLYESDWMWHTLTPDKLRAHLEHGQVLAARDESGEIAALAIASQVDPDDYVLPVGHIDGAGPTVASLARGLREHAAVLEAAKVEVVLRAGSALLQTFVGAGYKPEDEEGTAFYIYETNLKGAAL
jgi:GNAT superfamily N-acetyltransferase